MKKLAVIALLMVLFGSLITLPVWAGDHYAKVLNADKPGMSYDLSSAPVKGKTTIIDFYSEFCGPCVRLAPLLEQLDQKRSDIVVYKLNINRAGVKGIDWRSPLAQQYKLNSVPAFYIYDENGKITHSGQGAYQKVIELLKQSKLI